MIGLESAAVDGPAISKVINDINKISFHIRAIAPHSFQIHTDDRLAR